MGTLLDECRAAAPAWMAAEGWRDCSAGDFGACVWSAPPGPAIVVERSHRGVRVSATVWSATGTRLAPALAYVAGEVRAEMVARGLASEEPPTETVRLVPGAACQSITSLVFTPGPASVPAGLTVTSDTPGVSR